MYDNFSSILKNKGYDTMLYGSKFYLSNVWSTSNRKIWLAHYTSMTNYDKDFKVKYEELKKQKIKSLIIDLRNTLNFVIKLLQLI